MSHRLMCYDVFYLTIHYLFVDTLQQVRDHNLRYERSLFYRALAVNSVVHGRTVPGSDQPPRDCDKFHERFDRHFYLQHNVYGK